MRRSRFCDIVDSSCAQRHSLTMEGKREPFDENAMLAELERLRDSIQAARRARQEKSDEFDRAVQRFKRPPLPPPVSQQSEPELESRAVAVRLPAPAPAPVPEPASLIETAPAPPSLPEPMPVLAEQPAPRALTRQPTNRLGARQLIALAILGVVVAAGAVYWSRKPPSKVEIPATSRQTPAVQAPPVAAPTPAAPAPVSAPAPAAAVSIELKTLRPVWMRVTVDGQKQREGVVPADERLQLNANRTIVVRVGNGADVVIKTATGENPFGAAGQPVTRTFAKGEAGKD